MTAQNIARHVENVDRLISASQEDLEEIEGIGPERAVVVVAEPLGDRLGTLRADAVRLDELLR